ncbi:S-layer homology domain-containing protein [Paenibacillus sp. 1P07SE]|uniref:S-layer homology domain-containing protein n=1 Tax=Paenibacillus sp. 1P07SE TaxID=3132209 RepID=UPI0039A48D69
MYSIAWRRPLSVLLAGALVTGGLPLAWAPQTASADGAAIVTTSGVVIYDISGTEARIIDTGVTLDEQILNSVDYQMLDGATVLIDGFVSGDVLALELPDDFGAPITGSYNPNNGILTLSGMASVEAYEEALQHVVFSTTSTDASDRTVRFTLGKALPFGENGHYYEYINTGSPISWYEARAAAETDEMMHFGQRGYLATITSAAENSFVQEKTEGIGWLGAMDIQRDGGLSIGTGDWRWVTGPEGQDGDGLAFYTGYFTLPIHGPVDDEYNNWANQEPNNYDGVEYVAHIYSTGVNAGKWNDFSPTNNTVRGYIVEYGGMQDDQPIVITADKTIAIVNKADLNTGVEDAGGLDEENYVPSTWEAFENALAAAQEVLDDSEATQEEIDAALADLTDARAALVHVDVELHITEPAGDTVKVSKPELTGTVGSSEAQVTVVLKDADGVIIETRPVDVDEDGNWSFEPEEDLAAGDYTFEVTAEKDGESHTEIKELAVDLSSLSGLVVNDPSGNPVSLSPAFAGGTTDYTSAVSNSTGHVTLDLEALDQGGTIEFAVNGGVWQDADSGEATGQLPLNVGENTIVVRVTDAAGNVTEYTLTITRAAPSSPGWTYYPPYTPEQPGNEPQPEPETGELVTRVNGDSDSFATGTTSEGQTNAQVDLDKLGEALATGTGQKLDIYSPAAGDLQVEGLTAATLQELANKGAQLEIGNPLAIYPVPAGQLDLSAVSRQLNQAAPEDIDVHIEIARSSDELIASSRAKAAAAGYELLVDPVDLDMTFVHNGQTVRSELLSGYAAKYIALPEGIDPNRITTGVVVYPDGSAYHVPTVVTRIDNRYYAMINDLRSYGSYSVIWNPQDFDDVRTHWGQTDVNNIAARLDLQGNGDNTFSPNRLVTRAEFAEIIVTGLGLMNPHAPLHLFPDVAASAWYGQPVSIAQEFDIIRGYDDGNFYGQRQLTREQGFAIVARAHRLIDPQASVSSAAIETQLAGFADRTSVAAWARADVAQLIQAGIINGQGDSLLDPKAGMSRAEVTALIARLLQTTELINR